MSDLVSGYIFNLKKFAVHDGPGIRTTVFLQGCPMRCGWCHNPESMTRDRSENGNGHHNCLRPYYRPLPYRTAWKVAAEELMAEFRKDRIFFEESGGGVTFSGGEPLLQPEFLEEMLRSCRNENFHTAVDTSGHISWTWLEKVIPFTDLFLYDLKLIDDRQHRLHTGVSNRTILDNFRKLTERESPIIPRIPLIPSITDTPENLNGLVQFLQALPQVKRIDLLPYNPLGEGKYEKLELPRKLGKFKTQSPGRIREMKQIFASYGFEVFIGG